MKTLWSYLLLPFTGCVLISCYSIPNIQTNSRFSAEEKTGYLLLALDIQGDPSCMVFRITKEGRFLSKTAAWYHLKTGRNIIFVKAPEGEYTLNRVLDWSLKRVFTDFALAEFPFHVEKGVITYAGDMLFVISEIETQHHNKAVHFQYMYRDNYDEMFTYIRTNYHNIPDSVLILNECPQTGYDKYYEPIVIWGQ